MKNGSTELVFILDRSGSMAGLEDDTIGGFNAMIEKQKKLDGKVYVSTVLFANDSKVLHDRINIEKIEPLMLRRCKNNMDRCPAGFRAGCFIPLYLPAGTTVHPASVFLWRQALAYPLH